LKIPHTIPGRTDRIDRRQAKGSLGGTPPGFDADPCKGRNTAGRCFGRLERWRGIATRHDEHAITHLGGVSLAATFLDHRGRTQQTRPKLHRFSGEIRHARGTPV
jgi:putative transposase